MFTDKIYIYELNPRRVDKDDKKAICQIEITRINCCFRKYKSDLSCTCNSILTGSRNEACKERDVSQHEFCVPKVFSIASLLFVILKIINFTV